MREAGATAGFEYVDDGVTSDVTLRAWGPDLDALFTAAADATVQAMVRSLDSIDPAIHKHASVSADALDLLLLRLLEELVFWKDASRLLLRATAVRVRPSAGGYVAEAELRGEPIDAGKHDLEADVKGVTLHGLRVEPTQAGWVAEVTLDV